MERFFDYQTYDLNNSSVFQLSRPYCSEDIAVIESENMNILELIRCDLHSAFADSHSISIRILVLVYLPGPGPTLRQLAKNVGEGVWSSKTTRTEITKWI